MFVGMYRKKDELATAIVSLSLKARENAAKPTMLFRIKGKIKISDKSNKNKDIYICHCLHMVKGRPFN